MTARSGGDAAQGAAQDGCKEQVLRGAGNGGGGGRRRARTDSVGGCTSSGAVNGFWGGNWMKPEPTTFGFCTLRGALRGGRRPGASAGGSKQRCEQ